MPGGWGCRSLAPSLARSYSRLIDIQIGISKRSVSWVVAMFALFFAVAALFTFVGFSSGGAKIEPKPGPTFQTP